MPFFKKKENIYLGIDIGGTNLKFAVFNEQFDLLHKKNVETLSKDINILDKLINITKEIQNEFEISSLGIGVPGYVNNMGTVMVSPNIPEFTNLPLKHKLDQEFDIPIIVENDANAAAFAELIAGSAKDMKNFIYITLGTGIGGSIILNREIYKGNYGGAGEIGFLHIAFNNTNNYKDGTLEYFAGRNAIIDTAKKILKEFPESVLNGIEDFDVKDISEAVSNSDQAAIECLNRIGYYIGCGIASTFNLLDINQAIIGGGISNSHPILFETIIETIKQRALPTIAPYAEIFRASFGDESGIYGAGYLARSILVR